MWQAITAIVAFIAIVVTAITAACTTSAASKMASDADRISVAQATDNQLAIAINAIGCSDLSERIAGLLLLAQDTISGLNSIPEGWEEAVNRYSAALQIYNAEGLPRGLHGNWNQSACARDSHYWDAPK